MNLWCQRSRWSYHTQCHWLLIVNGVGFADWLTSSSHQYGNFEFQWRKKKNEAKCIVYTENLMLLFCWPNERTVIDHINNSKSSILSIGIHESNTKISCTQLVSMLLNEIRIKCSCLRQEKKKTMRNNAIRVFFRKLYGHTGSAFGWYNCKHRELFIDMARSSFFCSCFSTMRSLYVTL